MSVTRSKEDGGPHGRDYDRLVVTDYAGDTLSFDDNGPTLDVVAAYDPWGEGAEEIAVELDESDAAALRDFLSTWLEARR